MLEVTRGNVGKCKENDDQVQNIYEHVVGSTGYSFCLHISTGGASLKGPRGSTGAQSEWHFPPGFLGA